MFAAQKPRSSGPASSGGSLAAASPVRLASLQIPESGTWKNYVVWRVPAQSPAKGSVDNVLYLLVLNDLEDSLKGQILWFQYAYDSRLMKGAPSVPTPFIEATLAWNPERKRIYLVETSLLSGHAGVRVFEIDPTKSYGTYPPPAIAPELARHPPEPIVEFNPAEPNHIFAGGEVVQAMTEPNRLIISLWTMRELGTTKIAVYFSVDLDKKTWERVSAK
jgi:hypothetical protein